MTNSQTENGAKKSAGNSAEISAEKAPRTRKKELTIFIVLIAVAALLFAIVIGNFMMVFHVIMFPEKLPSYFGVTFSVAGGDELSGSRRGDLNIVKKVADDKIKVGDLVVDRHNGYFVLMRVIDKSDQGAGRYILTLTNDGRDEKALAYRQDIRQISGRVTHTYRGVGNVLIFGESVAGRIIFIGLPLACYIGYLAYDEIRRRKKAAAQKNAESAQEPPAA